MIRDSFRPWGTFTWMLSRFANAKWNFIGAVSMEDRCLTSCQILKDLNADGDSIIFRIKDADSRHTSEVERKTDINQVKFLQNGLDQTNIHNHLLLGRHGEIANEISRFLNICGENLVIDISSLPKKYFFLLIRKALEKSSILQNILVTYTLPKAYDTDLLAENPEGWKPLPGFLSPRSEPAEKSLIIGLGYEPLGLPDLYSSGLFNNAEIRLLFPFPASPNSVSRNWNFARLLEPVPSRSSANIERVDSMNVPDMFDKLSYITNNGSVYSILAPFGPKPMSLAMCLFAVANSQKTNPPSVFYTQPTVYSPQYSSGVKHIDGVPVVQAYCIRLNGNNLYN